MLGAPGSKVKQLGGGRGVCKKGPRGNRVSVQPPARSMSAPKRSSYSFILPPSTVSANGEHKRPVHGKITRGFLPLVQLIRS